MWGNKWYVECILCWHQNLFKDRCNAWICTILEKNKKTPKGKHHWSKTEGSPFTDPSRPASTACHFSLLAWDATRNSLRWHHSSQLFSFGFSLTEKDPCLYQVTPCIIYLQLHLSFLKWLPLHVWWQGLVEVRTQKCREVAYFHDLIWYGLKVSCQFP